MYQDVFMVDVNKAVLYFIQESQSVIFPLLLQRLPSKILDGIADKKTGVLSQ